ncbi:metalloregulator ArsR/SmtB family transcription factor [Verrucomicrobiales bacterium]|jgi:ArsR family transcriptional regulator|nr:metalloregulator ArsR/SmtB family transcription factor [Verrucomicrobiales bacterium]MDA9923336.1 metalloregulator ArsR/SmtB family transcription factor [Verrucomicrobiales bacterium]MDB3940877.1 metalloregulator ArsR/SmtB family transcription factor [Verrucomicrobiales bacterium]
MSSTLKTLRILSDPTRIRILHLLRAEELSVVELQDILGMGQSRISTHLSQLRQAGLVVDRRVGKNSIYAFDSEVDDIEGTLLAVLDKAAGEVEEIADDRAAMELSLAKRRDKARAYFDALAGKFGKTYLPGRSWKALGESLLKLMPPMVIADLGAGEGTFSQLLAQRAELVIAVDNSEKMVEFGSQVAKENGYENLEYRLGGIEEPPIEDESVDLAFFSQSLHHAEKPAEAVAAAHRILKPGGRIVILDLLKHQFEEARELYADHWLGFSELDISRFLNEQKFQDIDISVVDREADPPNFQTLMAIATKALS